MDLTIRQTAQLWIAAGGPERRATEFTAIALGESGVSGNPVAPIDTSAVSSAGAIGIWQIMPFNAAPNGYSVADLYNPLDNARIAVKMSGGGTNCAAWDSAYADIQRSGRYTFLGWPEQGSADFNNLAVVSSVLGTDKLGGAVPPRGALDVPALARATHQLDAQLNHMLQTVSKQLVWQRMQANSFGTVGWRP